MHNPLVQLNSLITDLVEGSPFIQEFLKIFDTVLSSMLPWFLLLVVVATIVMTVVQRVPQIRGAAYYTKLLNPLATHSPEEVAQRTFLIMQLGATVGIGNMGGVSLAIELGGPGVLFWMFLFGLVAASLKCASCTLASKFQQPVRGGAVGSPMAYMVKTLGRVGWVVAIMYSIMLVVAGMFGANAFQVNQAAGVISVVVSSAAHDPTALALLRGLLLLIAVPTAFFFCGVAIRLRNTGQRQLRRLSIALCSVLALGFFGLAVWSFTPSCGRFLTRPDAAVTVKTGFGIVLCLASAIVLFRGVDVIKRASNIVVPVMGITYLAACLYVNAMNIDQIGNTLHVIVISAFKPAAFGWGTGMTMISVASMGFLRGLFSSEAGLGSGSFAQSSVPTDQPVRSGLSAMPATFVDTNIICMITGLTIVSSGVYANAIGSGELKGITLVLEALQTELGAAAGVFLIVAAMLFAFSTVIAWSYYGDVASRDLFRRLRRPFAIDDNGAEAHVDLNSSRVVKVHRVFYASIVLVAALVELQSFMPVMDFAFVSLFIINTLVLLWNAPLLWRVFGAYWKSDRADPA